MPKRPSLPAPSGHVTATRARSVYRSAPRTMSLRNWARNEYGSRFRGDLSSKLAKIVHGPVP